MGRPSGRADLPLHGGHVPRWLSERMARLGAVLIEALVIELGVDEVLRRLSHPFWFQSLGAVLGMDWHSSGITTSVVGALKRGLEPIQDELGLFVCGGRGRQSKKTPDELAQVGDRTGLDARPLQRTSRLVAKVDNAAVQDGFQIYLHAFFVTKSGRWTVVQQGMCPELGTARRYHWLSEGLESFVDAPHAAIDGERVGEIINLTDRRAELARSSQVELIQEGPDELSKLIARARRELEAPETPQLVMPMRHEVRGKDVVARRLYGSLAAAAEVGPTSFEELLLVPGIGPRTVESLAMVSELVYGAPSRFTDPARYSLAHGGKDGHPFPVPLEVYDATIRVFKNAVDKAKLGQDDKLAAIRALDRRARTLEATADGPTVEAWISMERRRSHEYGGMTVSGPARPPTRAQSSARAPRKKRGRQLDLW